MITVEGALLVAGAVGAAGLMTRVVTPAGVLAGCVIAATLALAPSAAPFATFAAFVVGGIVVTKLARRHRPIRANDDDRRGAVHAIANCGVAAALVLLGRLTPLPAEAVGAAACAALGGMLADTIGGEIGMTFGGRPRCIIGFAPVAVGANGGVTLVGTAASVFAALIAAGVATAAGAGGTRAFVAISIGAASASFADSVLGATIEHRLTRHGNAVVNGAASAVGAAIGFALVHRAIV